MASTIIELHNRPLPLRYTTAAISDTDTNLILVPPGSIVTIEADDAVKFWHHDTDGKRLRVDDKGSAAPSDYLVEESAAVMAAGPVLNCGGAAGTHNNQRYHAIGFCKGSGGNVTLKIRVEPAAGKDA